jgi:undecaprenyl-diphosphatase
VQAYNSDWLDNTLSAVSWLGFPPQSNVLFGIIVILLFVWGARWAAVTEAIAAVGSGGLYLVLEHFVAQPRPTSDLVRVMGPIQMTGFPSGHIATFTAVFGFLGYLGYRRLSGTVFRWVPVLVVVVLVMVMSLARIYSGHHWASDVVAGWLLGGLWLAVVVRLYIWGEARLAQRSKQATLRWARRQVGRTSAH